MAERTAEATRKTKETDITIRLSLDGTGQCEASTGIGFFDHMLDQLARHGLFDLTVRADGDLHIDAHHTVEDTGIVLGDAFAQALGDRAGIRRYGWAAVPLDEALVLVSVDISGRGLLTADLGRLDPMVGEFPSELLPEFLRAFASAAGMTLHVRKLCGVNSHHIIEASFKALARALRDAVSHDPRSPGVPSTKGVL